MQESTVRRVRDDDVAFLFGLWSHASLQWHRLAAPDLHFGNFVPRFWADLFAGYVVEVGGDDVGYAGAYALDAVHRTCWVECIVPGSVAPSVAVEAGGSAIAKVIGHTVDAANVRALYAYSHPRQDVFAAAGGWEHSGTMTDYDYAAGRYHDRLVYHRLAGR
jgi:hypothetical protein